MQIAKISCLISFVILAACTRQESGVSKLTISLPSSSQLAMYSAMSSAPASSVGFSTSSLNYTPMTVTQSNWNSFLNPSAISGFNCFLVFVSGPGIPRIGTCTTTDNMMFDVAYFAGGYPAGSSLQLNVASGSGRIVTLVGFNAESGYCKDFTNNDVAKEHFSYPHILARQVVNLSPGTMVLNMTATLAANTTKISDCDIHTGSSNGTTGGTAYGMGEDGDFTWSAAVFLSSATSAAHGSPVYLTSISKVDGIALSGTNKYDITIHENWNSGGNKNILVNDEIMLYVIAENKNPHGCGPNLFPGFSTYGRVLAAGSGVGAIVTAEIFDDRFSTIPNGMLSGTSFGDASVTDPRDFCRVVAVRVPHLRNVTVSAATTVKVGGGSLGSLNTLVHTDGIMAVRISGLLQVNAYLTFDMSAAGFKGGGTSSKMGEGVNGWNSQTISMGNADFNASGYNMTAGYGGGGGGNGGGAQPGIAQYDSYGCFTTGLMNPACLFGKFFLGGGGGGSAAAGGLGGGIARIMAKQVNTTNTLDIYTGGGSGVSGSGGGGGGSTFLEMGDYTQNGGMNLNNMGGTGAGAGSGGGGGTTHFIVHGVHTRISGGISAPVTGGGGTASGASGNCLFEHINYTVAGCN